MTRMRMSMVAGVAVAAFATGTATGQRPAEAVRPAVVRALGDSAAGWNTGDLDRFMAVYKRSPDITYVSGGEVVRGFDAVRARYAGRFSAAGDKGRLAVDVLDVRLVGSDHAYVVGRYHLHRATAPEVSGITTLLFEHASKGWLIVADHS